MAVSTPLDITGIGWLRRQIFIKVADRISVLSPRLSVLSTERCAASLCDGQRSSNKCKVKRKHHHWGTRLNSAEASKPFLFRFMNIMLATRNAVFCRKFYRLVIKKDLSLITKTTPATPARKNSNHPAGTRYQQRLRGVYCLSVAIQTAQTSCPVSSLTRPKSPIKTTHR